MKLRFSFFTKVLILALFFIFCISFFSIKIKSVQSQISTNFTFTKNLKLGDNNYDVLMLQKALNKNSDTRIAISGLGSPGQETGYFGGLTQKAVITFQNKYPTDILVPAGLFYGNGFVGPLTIKKLNSSNFSASTPVPIYTPPSNPIIQYQVSPSDRIDIHVTDRKIDDIQQNIIQNINTAIAAHNSNPIGISDTTAQTLGTVFLYSFSEQAALQGSTISISGDGFDTGPTNSIYFGTEYVIKNISASNSKGITFTVPPLPLGKYYVVVKSSRGISNSAFFIIKNQNTPAVTVQQIIPNKVKYGSQITITGSGFTTTENELYTTFGKIEHVNSSDGKTLTTIFKPEYLSEIAKNAAPGGEYSVVVYIVNNNGVTINPMQFSLTF
jgi:hypothetical protein